MIIVEIILVLLIRNGYVNVYMVDHICRRSHQFPWRDKHDLRVNSILLIDHVDAHAEMLPSSKIGFKFARVSDALLLYAHYGKEYGLALGTR